MNARELEMLYVPKSQKEGCSWEIARIDLADIKFPDDTTIQKQFVDLHPRGGLEISDRNKFMICVKIPRGTRKIVRTKWLRKVAKLIKEPN